MSVVVISDVPMGFGSPQVWRLAASLGERFNTGAVVIAPSGAAPGWSRPGLSLIEIELAAPASHHCGEIEFALAAARELNRIQPRVLVVCAFLGAPALLWLKRKPPLVIYYGYEHTDGVMPRIEHVFAGVSPSIDVAVFPEEFRASLDAPRLSLKAKPAAIVYNASTDLAAPTPAAARNGRAFYGGLIDPERTYGDALLGGAFDAAPLDLYGRLEGFDEPAARIAELRARASAVAYHGLAPNDAAFAEAQSRSVCALVAWAPLTESTYFACPNKFFEAIARGVPPVCAPHPQCVRLVSKYQCGWLMDAFSAAALLSATQRALAAAETPLYAEIVEACAEASRRELNWDAQFAKLDRVLASVPAG